MKCVDLTLLAPSLQGSVSSPSGLHRIGTGLSSAA